MTREDAEHQSEHWQDLIDEKDAEIERLQAELATAKGKIGRLEKVIDRMETAYVEDEI